MNRPALIAFAAAAALSTAHAQVTIPVPAGSTDSSARATIAINQGNFATQTQINNVQNNVNSVAQEAAAARQRADQAIAGAGTWIRRFVGQSKSVCTFTGAFGWEQSCASAHIDGNGQLIVNWSPAGSWGWSGWVPLGYTSGPLPFERTVGGPWHWGGLRASAVVRPASWDANGSATDWVFEYRPLLSAPDPGCISCGV